MDISAGFTLSHAILVGSVYSTLASPLPAVESNLAAVRAALTDETASPIPGENCVTLLDPHSQADVFAALAALAKSLGPGGALLVYLTGRASSAAGSGRAMRLALSGPKAGSALSFDALAQRLEKIAPARWLVVFDVCAPDAGSGQTGNEISEFAGSGHGAVWIATSTERAFAGSSHGLSPFTAALADGLRKGTVSGAEAVPPDAAFTALLAQLQGRDGVQLRGLNCETSTPLGYDDPAVSVFGPRAVATGDRPRTPWMMMPGFAGETTDGRELLGVDQDALALAVLVGSESLQPPLAIGVHGEWGSGKTFFMKVLDGHLQTLARPEGDHPYCRRVVRIWFNAWHYAESNLWASLLHQIISDLHSRSSLPQRERDQALAKLGGLAETAAEAQTAVRIAETAVVQTASRLSALQKQELEARRAAMTLRGEDIWSAVVINRSLRRNLNEKASALGIPQAEEETAPDLSRVANAVQEAVADGSRLATYGRRSPLVTAVVIGVMLSIAGLVLAAAVDWSRTWLGPTTALITQLAAAGGAAAGWISRKSAVSRTLLEPVERMRQEIDNRLAEAQAAHRDKIAAVDQDLATAQLAVAAAQRSRDEAEARWQAAKIEVAELTGGRLLTRYIENLARKDEYAQHLGVAALAYKDLTGLSVYLKEAAGDRAAPVDRIVLYIDDLDRCQPEVVVRVLEAVHLLLALQLFVVVVGVDAELLARSLRDRHRVLLQQPLDVTAPGSSPTPRDFLDKIFQLTYQLPPMGADACAALLREAAVRSRAVVRGSRSTPGSPAEGSTAAGGPAEHAPGQPSTTAEAPRAGAEPEETGSAAEPAVDIPTQALELSERELEIFDIVAPLVGSTPRRAKRFLNIYRVAKARILIDTVAPDRLTGQDAPVGLIVLVALLIGLPDTAPALIGRAAPTFGDWLTANLAALGGNPAADQRVTAFAARAEKLEALTFESIATWLPVVRSFTSAPVGGRR